MGEVQQVLVFLVLVFACVFLAIARRRWWAGRKKEGWMHLCEVKGRDVWFPYGSRCVFCRKELG